MDGIWKYDLRNIVRLNPRLTLAINLLALPVAALWVWLSFTFHLPSALFLTVFLSWSVFCTVVAWLMIDAFEEGSWIVVFVQMLLVYFWIAALVKLVRVIKGKEEFPALTS